MEEIKVYVVINGGNVFGAYVSREEAERCAHADLGDYVQETWLIGGVKMETIYSSREIA